MQGDKIIRRFFLTLLFGFTIIINIVGCDHRHKPQVENAPAKYIQTNVIKDPTKQYKLIQDTLKLHYNTTYYAYDSKVWGGDHWDNVYKEMESQYDAFKKGMGVKKDYGVDCEDTAISIIIFLIQHGFPYQQLELYYCLVPYSFMDVY